MNETSNLSPWPGRLAFLTWLAAVPLVVMGGLVTTLRAGMAEDGWLKPEGHWLWLYPLEKRMASWGRFVEHHHRELGTLVGVLAILTVLAAWRGKAGRSGLIAAVIGLLAVSGQGILGGTRVLENNIQLAFLHGVVGQIVFGVLAGVALVLALRWRRFPGLGSAQIARLGGPATWLLLALLTQVTLGAWYRHGHGHTAIALHGFGAILVLVLGLRFAGRMRRTAEEPGLSPEAASIASRTGFWISALLYTQVLLGGVALYALFVFSDGMGGDNISNSEIVFSTLHMSVGAMLTAAVTYAFLWARRFDREAGGGAA